MIKLLRANSDLKYKLNKSILPENILEIENLIKRNGAIATKLLGAGGGGFILGIFENNLEF